MARLLGIEIPDKKRIEVSLTYIFGMGASRSAKVLKDAKINPDKRTRTLTLEELDVLRKIIEKNYQVEGDLRRIVGMNIKRLKDINSYRGIRHQKHLPVRGQRTKTNSRTVRGNIRISAGSGRKAAGQKT